MKPVQRALKPVLQLSTAWWTRAWKPAAQQRDSNVRPEQIKSFQMWSRLKAAAAVSAKGIQSIQICFKLKTIKI